MPITELSSDSPTRHLIQRVRAAASTGNPPPVRLSRAQIDGEEKKATLTAVGSPSPTAASSHPRFHSLPKHIFFSPIGISHTSIPFIASQTTAQSYRDRPADRRRVTYHPDEFYLALNNTLTERTTYFESFSFPRQCSRPSSIQPGADAILL